MGNNICSCTTKFLDKRPETKEQKEKRLKKTYGNIPLQEVVIYKVMPTLGLAIEGGINSSQMFPRVFAIQPNGSTFYSKTDLKVGNILLEVNGTCLVGLQHSEVAANIANAFLDETQDYLTFLVTEDGWQPKTSSL
ncbi:whirlin-like isoform X2 [Octopus vulgaris]|uniref:Whirlin-like isoform X2 n=2 Tax=Octopus TaxID=6643 RepID=A0AA36ALJ4_OCTVU|nr:whirlin-like [Octopus sinensis]XP_036356704.1 whirlin-like [Octopus sinensis]CAI9716897.1 whirlin-like isoform X2 [Octopus vulgaris]